MDTMAFKASLSLKSMKSKALESKHSYPSWYFLWPVAANAPAVRPWKEFRQATNFVRLVCFAANFNAASFASAPLLQNMETANGDGDDRGERLSEVGLFLV